MSHQFSSSKGLELARGSGGVAIGKQIGRSQGLWLPQVQVQGVDQSRAFLYDSHAGVMMPVDPPFVPFRIAKPTLQVEVIARHFSRVATGEQSWLKTRHHLGHLSRYEVRAVSQLVTQFFVQRFA